MKKSVAILMAIIMSLGLVGCQEIVDLGIDVLDELASITAEPMQTDAGEDGILETIEPTESEDVSLSSPALTDAIQATSTAAPTKAPTPTPDIIDEDGFYYSKEDVALYINTYGHLPENFITKNEARSLGWEGGTVERFADEHAIGGDKFGNYEGVLPKKKGRTYYECDIDTHNKSSRGAKRIVFSNDGLIYYTDDHYETFTLLYGED